MTKPKNNWCLYLVRCIDGSIYTGISIDVQARIDKHNSGRGAKYTSSRLPVKLIYYESQPNRGSAMKREKEIKTWSKRKKENLASKYSAIPAVETQS